MCDRTVAALDVEHVHCCRDAASDIETHTYPCPTHSKTANELLIVASYLDPRTEPIVECLSSQYQHRFAHSLEVGSGLQERSDCGPACTLAA